jgi:hypothetical protein
MAQSSEVFAGDDILASQYNNLRKDTIDTSLGHTHNGADSKTLAIDGVGNSQIQNNAVDNNKIADNSVSNSKLQAAAVSETKIQDGEITVAKLKNIYRILDDEGAFTSSKTISGLDGDTYRNYHLEIYVAHFSYFTLGIAFNGDGSAIYSSQGFYTDGGTVTPEFTSGQPNMKLTFWQTILDAFFTVDIYTKIRTGGTKHRMIKFDGTEQAVSVSGKYFAGRGAWPNVLDNITSINIVLPITITEGYFRLWRGTQ